MARKQAWNPRGPGAGPRLEILNQMARDMVGDGERPDVFFVSINGNVTTVTSSFRTAYEEWLRVSRTKKVETSLEDRVFGVIASVEPEDEGSSRLIRIDSSKEFLEMNQDHEVE